MLRLNCIRNELGWVDFDECRAVQFETQTDLQLLLARKLRAVRENSAVYFVYHRKLPERFSASKFR